MPDAAVELHQFGVHGERGALPARRDLLFQLGQPFGVARTFVRREVRRGSQYQGIILDPPKYGRGPDGEGWPFGRPVWVSEIYAVLAAVPLVAYVEEVTVHTDDAGRVLTDDAGLVTGVALDADELVDATTDGLAVWDTAGDRHG